MREINDNGVEFPHTRIWAKATKVEDRVPNDEYRGNAMRRQHTIEPKYVSSSIKKSQLFCTKGCEHIFYLMYVEIILRLKIQLNA